MRTAQRRHDDERVLRRRLKTPKQQWITRDDRLNDEERQRWQGIVRTTGTTCSCWACRTARRYYGPSAQERRQVAWLEAA